MRLTPAAVLGAVVAASPAAAQPLIFSGTVQGRIGFATDPFLRDEGGSSALAGFTFAPKLTRKTELGTTTLSGLYDTDKYLSRYGRSETINADLGHTQQLSQRLSMTGHIGYIATNSPTDPNFLNRAVVDPLLIDALATRQRSRRLSGDLSAQWQPTQRDAISYGLNAAHQTYDDNAKDDFPLDSYNQFGVNAAYLHALNARTRIGVRAYASHVDSKVAPDSTSIAPSIAIDQVLTPVWSLNGDVGLIFQRVDGGISGTSLGLHLSLCGTYPRNSICLSAARDSSPSGLGGLRTMDSVSANFRHVFDEHSSISASASYQTSHSATGYALGDLKFLAANVSYDRDLSRRLSIGTTGRYQRREGDYFYNASSIAATVELRLKIGRLK